MAEHNTVLSSAVGDMIRTKKGAAVYVPWLVMVTTERIFPFDSNNVGYYADNSI